MYRFVTTVTICFVVVHGEHSQASEHVKSGETHSPISNTYIEYIPGDLPLVISVPHGGHLKPASIPDREFGSPGVYDVRTQELARVLLEELKAKTGRSPHVVISLLHRKKLDANRGLIDGAQGNPIAETAWNEFHACIDTALNRIHASFGSGLYIDLHGHRHAKKLVELGYLVVAADLEQSDSVLDRRSVSASIGSLAFERKLRFSQILRGDFSLGGVFEKHGYEAVPAPGCPSPGGAPYFSGGYNIESHSLSRADGISGIQIEVPSSLRESDEVVGRFAADLADVLIEFLKMHYSL